MNKIIAHTISGSAFNEVAGVPPTAGGFFIQNRSAADFQMNYLGDADTNNFITVKSGSSRRVSWPTVRTGFRLFVKGTPGNIIEIEVGATEVSFS